MSKTEPLKSPLKWAGGKRWLVPHLLPIYDKYRDHRLVEPFCGGLSIALGLQPEKALLNDINPHLINFWNWVRWDFLDLKHIMFQNTQDNYYFTRNYFNTLIKTDQQGSSLMALMFYYLNKTGFRGLCRFNKEGEFNVPYGFYKDINYEFDVLKYSKLFKGWEFTNNGFEDLQIEDNDFIYADPPYDGGFTGYYGTFGWEDQLRLAEWLAKQPGPVVASNLATDRILKLYTELGFDITILEAPRSISCNGNRQKVKEMFATRNTQ